MNTTIQKVDQTITEIKEWLDKPDTEEFYYLKSINCIKENISKETFPKSTMFHYKTMDHWFSNNFVYKMLLNEQTKYKIDAAKNGYHLLAFAGKLAEKYPNNPPNLSFDKIAYWFANCLSLKWYQECNFISKIINKELFSEFLDGGWELKSTAWFIIEISNKGYEQNIDLTQFNYPKDMGVYEEALKNWNTTDLTFLDTMISKLCNFHLEHATYGKKETTADIQFGESAWFVYAFEILAWLSIREMIGLQNPEQFSHPLMHLVINKLPKEIIPMPKDELFEKVMKRLNPPKSSWSVFD